MDREQNCIQDKLPYPGDVFLARGFGFVLMLGDHAWVQFSSVGGIVNASVESP